MEYQLNLLLQTNNETEPFHQLSELKGGHRVDLEISDDRIEGVLGYAHNEDVSFRPGIYVTKEQLDSYLEAKIPGNSSVIKEYELALRGLAGSIGGLFAFQEAHPAHSYEPGHEGALRECRKHYIENVSDNLARAVAFGVRMELRKRRCDQGENIVSESSSNEKLASV